MMRGQRDMSPERVRLIEGLARQTMAIFGAHPDNGSPAAVQALAAAIEARDNYTHAHSEQVVALATDVARLLGLSPPRSRRCATARCCTTSASWRSRTRSSTSRARSTDAEWLVMAEHPVIGERILRRTPQLGHLAPIVRHEHERWDGGGYPDGLADTSIPIGSRIILACDAYNAMITTRPYRDAMAEPVAIEELRDKAGTQFDPQVVEALLETLGAVSGRGLRRRDQRRGVGQPRRPVQAAVLREVAQVELRGLDPGLLAAVARAARAPRRVVAHAERERGRPARHRQRDQVALLDVEGAAERELDGHPEPRLEVLDRRSCRSRGRTAWCRS